MTTTTERPPVDPRIWTRRVAVTRARGRKRLKIALAVLAFFAILAVGFVAVHSSLFGAKHVSVTGAVHTPTSDVISAAGLLAHPPLIDIDTTSAAKRIEALPWIKSARVSVHWPDSVTVAVIERTAVAVVRGPEKGASHFWALVDSTGRVLADQTARPAGVVTMEVFVAPGPPGSELSVSDMPGVDVAGSLPSLLARRVVSVDVAAGNGVTLGMTGNLSAIIGAPVDLGAKYVALASVLASAPLASGDVINVTVPEEPAVGPGNAHGRSP